MLNNSLCILALSSSGLGHRPLTAKTRVRFPVGSIYPIRLCQTRLGLISIQSPRSPTNGLFRRFLLEFTLKMFDKIVIDQITVLGRVLA